MGGGDALHAGVVVGDEHAASGFDFNLMDMSWLTSAPVNL
jgi:hypothetical protein